MDPAGAVPAEIAALYQKGLAQGLTRSESAILQGWLIDNRGQVAQGTWDAIDAVASGRDVDPTGMMPSSTPSVGEQVTQALDTVTGDALAAPPSEAMPLPPVKGLAPAPSDYGGPLDAIGGLIGGAGQTVGTIGSGLGSVGSWLDERFVGLPVGAGDAPFLSDTARGAFSGQGIPATGIPTGTAPPSADMPAPPPADLVIPPPGGTPIPQDLTSGVMTEFGLTPGDTPTRSATRQPAPVGAEDRRGKRRGARGDVMPKDRARVGSEHFDTNPAYLRDIVNDPERAGTLARMIAQKMGGGPMTAQLILPEVQRAQGLLASGVIGVNPTRKGLGRSIDEGAAGTAVDAIYDWVTEAAAGTGGEVNDEGLYRNAMRRVMHTPASELQMGAESGEMNALTAQVQTTMGALLAGIADPELQARTKARLNEVATQWFFAVQSDPLLAETMTFPRFLKEHGGMRLMTEAPQAPRERSDDRQRRREERA